VIIPSRGTAREQLAVGQVFQQVKAVLLEDQVSDDHDGLAAGAQLTDQVPEPQVGFPVEPLVGLVQQQHVRVVQQRQGQVQLLPGAAGQLADCPV